MRLGSPGQFSYQWYNCGGAILGVTSADYCSADTYYLKVANTSRTCCQHELEF